MSKTDDGAPGIFEMLEEMKSQLRKEMDEKLENLMKRIQELEESTKLVDDKQ